MRNSKRFTHFILNIFALFAFFTFTNCDNLLFDGDIVKDLSDQITVTYEFYEYNNSDSEHQDVTFQIGRQATNSDFPVFTHEDAFLMGWRYLKSLDTGLTSLPSNFSTDNDNYIISVKVSPEAVALYAVWAKKCHINFVTNCDKTIEEIIVPEGKKLSQNSVNLELLREDYTFAGWYTEESFENPFSVDNIVTSDLTLYAKWLPILTVRFHKNDGSEEKYENGEYRWESVQKWNVNNENENGERNFWLPECMFGEREGYGFVGWAKAADSSTPDYYTSDEIENISENIDLYAVWSTDIVTVTYNDTLGGNSPRTAKYGRGAHIRIGSIWNTRTEDNNSTYSNYENLRNLWKVTAKQINWWAENPDATEENTNWDSRYNNSNTHTLTDNLNLYTIWGPKVYNVWFGYIENEKNVNFTSISVEYNTIPKKPLYTPYMPGYTFAGWYESNDGGRTLSSSEYSFTTVFNETSLGENSYGLNLYAKFIPGESARTEFFVIPRNWWPNGNDQTGNGAYNKPFETITRAIQEVNAQNDSTKDYVIYMRGEIIDSLNITSLNAKSLTIKHDPDYNSERWFNIKPSGYRESYDTEEEIPSVLTYEKTIALTFENLTLYGKMSESDYIHLTDGSRNILPRINTPPTGNAEISLRLTEREESDIEVSSSRSGNTYTFTAPAGYATYQWRLNNTIQTALTTRTANFDTSSWANGRYDITLIVEDSDGNIYSYFSQIIKG